MNVQQLIEKLQQYPAEMQVVISGHEDGYNDINEFDLRSIQINEEDRDRWYYGKYSDDNEGIQSLLLC